MPRWRSSPYTSTTGSSGVLHQAGSYGKAVVLPNIGDFAEVITQEGYGEFFNPDEPATLARADRQNWMMMIFARRWECAIIWRRGGFADQRRGRLVSAALRECHQSAQAEGGQRSSATASAQS